MNRALSRRNIYVYRVYLIVYLPFPVASIPGAMKYIRKHSSLKKRYVNALQIFVPVLLLVSYELQISSVVVHKADAFISAVNIISESSNRLSHDDNHKAAQVLMVIFAIPDGYPTYASVAQASHRAYANRYGYSLVIQRRNLRLENSILRNGQDSQTTTMQKLLAYSLARGERYVLVLDYDTAIAPWSPPIHEHLKDLSGRIGMVGSAKGILGEGVLLFEAKTHRNWMRLFYDARIRNGEGDQGTMRRELIGKKLMMPLNAAWGRNASSGLLSNSNSDDLGTLFKKTYFINFFGDKDNLLKLERWTKENSISFDYKYPVQYSVAP